MFIPGKDVSHLTGLRGVAAIMVMWVHLSQLHALHLKDIIPLIGQGRPGVDILFVLSGYIIPHAFTVTFKRISFQPYFVFVWRRIARLYPIDLATLIGHFIHDGRSLPIGYHLVILSELLGQ